MLNGLIGGLGERIGLFGFALIFLIALCMILLFQPFLGRVFRDKRDDEGDESKSPLSHRIIGRIVVSASLLWAALGALTILTLGLMFVRGLWLLLSSMFSH